jgi:hypothetical protein
MNPALPWISAARPLVCSTSSDQASPHRYAFALVGGTTGSVMSPGKRSGGQWSDSTQVRS